MDGAFISYHNTKKTFGFEYVKKSTIEKLIFGEKRKADISFIVTSKLMTEILDRIKKFLRE